MPQQLYELEQVMEACMSVFARHGYKNTSTVMLAEAAGISKALIFHHFKSKKNLYFTLLEHCMEKAQTELPVGIVFEYEDFFEAMDQVSRLKFDYFRKYPNEYKLVNEAFYSTPAELREDIEEKYGEMFTLRHQIIEKLFEKVPLREDVDRKHACTLVILTLEHFEKKFITEVTDMEQIDEGYGQRLFDEMNHFYSMICKGIGT